MQWFNAKDGSKIQFLGLMMIIDEQLRQLKLRDYVDEAIANGATIIYNKASKVSIFEDKIIYDVNCFLINWYF